MKKIKRLLTIGFAFVLVLCASVFVGCSQAREERYARQRIARFFEIEVPKDAKMVYNYFQLWQEANGYTVFTFEKEPGAWPDESGFSKEKDEEFESIAKEEVDDFFKFSKRTKNVLPEKYIPDFEKEYFWREYAGEESDTVFLIYVPEDLMLVFLISIW